ncbi:hypothetical protein OG976_17230 [Mycobacterium sp. NBC_00419]|uniref:hypothetical protein n=1 Tax=Mycobacterium sp. NBC_00419 TaxID=2975989 RepID=UPI002E1CD672
MTVVNDPTHAALAASSSTPGNLSRIFMAVVLTLVVIAAIVGIVIAAASGQGHAVVGITLIAGGLLGAAALC